MELLTGPNLAALITLPGVGEKRAVALATRFACWDALLAANLDSLIDTLGPTTGRRVAEHLPDHPLTAPLPPHMQVVSYHESHYPDRLRTIPHPPTLLWWMGTLPNPHTAALAIVGTRTPTPFGAQVTALVAATAAEQGIPTISGLALGVDSIGHEACLQAGLPTWAVIGQGLSTLPTRGDRARIAATILSHRGGLISEVPPDTPVARHLLTQRNRLQTGLTDAVCIAQTGLPTDTKPAGTIHTARFALEQRRLLAVAVPPPTLTSHTDFAGNSALINPDGIDPALMFVTDPTLAAHIRSKKPAADLLIERPDDTHTLISRITTAPRTVAPPETEPPRLW